MKTYHLQAISEARGTHNEIITGTAEDAKRRVAEYMTVGVPIPIGSDTVEYQRARAVTVTPKL
jgi:hypothetical protein